MKTLAPALRASLHTQQVHLSSGRGLGFSREMGLIISSPWEHFQFEILEAIQRPFQSIVPLMRSQGFRRED